MKIYLQLFFFLVLAASCKNLNQREVDNESIVYRNVITPGYELSLPVTNTSAVLILFGGISQNADVIKREFQILEKAKENKLAVLYVNFNKNLWLTEDDKSHLKNFIENIFTLHSLPYSKIYVGGFSSGGNVSMLLADYLVSSKSIIRPSGVFVIDSPVDLYELYTLAQKNLVRKTTYGSVQEATWIIQLFEDNLGGSDLDIEQFESVSPYTSKSKNIENLANLDGINIRFYSEPDTIWWKENRSSEPEDLNAYWIEKLAAQLELEFPTSKVEFIATENRGCRASGDRHPHSWSIVNVNNLVDWIINN